MMGHCVGSATCYRLYLQVQAVRVPANDGTGMIRAILYSIVTGSLRVLAVLVARTECIGFQNIKPGPYLLVSNHISHFDPPLMGSYFPRKIDFMAMRELFLHPATAFFFTWVDTFPVDRSGADSKAVRTAIQRLKQGHIVGIFPEGGLRTGENSVLSGKDLPRGAATLAHMAGVPVRPCVVIGTDQFYAWRSLFRRPQLFMALGEELTLDPALHGGEAVRELNRRIEVSMRELHIRIRQHPRFSEKLVPRTAQERWAEA